MSRNHEKLVVFQLADELAVAVYRATVSFPVAERFGLQSQLRRAAVSVPTNTVEGAARRSTKEYLQFLSVALGSASETRYLLGLANRIGYIEVEAANAIEQRYGELVRSLQRLIDAFSR